jgi:hypothetical protein
MNDTWEIGADGSGPFLSIAPSIRPTVAAMAPADVDRFKTGVRARLPCDAKGRITYASRANAVKGRVPSK